MRQNWGKNYFPGPQPSAQLVKLNGLSAFPVCEDQNLNKSSRTSYSLPACPYDCNYHPALSLGKLLYLPKKKKFMYIACVKIKQTWLTSHAFLILALSPPLYCCLLELLGLNSF